MSEVAVALPVSEAAFQKAVIELAHRFNWKCAHFRPAQNQRGQWLTAVQGDGAGFPDLVLVRDRIILAELKAEKGTMSDNQLAWQDTLRGAGVEYHCWKPKDWDEIEKTLRATIRSSHFARNVSGLG